MNYKFQNNFIGYFKFYFDVLGVKLIVNFLLSIFVSLIDGIGLAMFIPLLQAVDSNSVDNAGSVEPLSFLLDFILFVGLDLNVSSILLLLIFLFSLKGALKFAQLSYQVTLRQHFMKKIRFRLVDNLNGLSYEGFLKLDAGRIQNTVISEVQKLFTSMNAYFNAGQGITMVGTYVTLAFISNYQFALLVTLCSLFSNFLYKRIYVATKKAALEISRKGHDFNGYLIQLVKSFKYLKATNSFPTFSFRLKRIISETEMLNRRMGIYSAVTTSVREPMIIAIVAIVIYVQMKWMGATLPSILVSLLLFYRALTALMTTQNYWQTFMQNIGGMSSVSVMSDEMADMQERVQGKLFSKLSESITLNDIEFYYGNRKVLRGVNITIPKNRTIALVGESGSGKTTVANLVSGLISPVFGSLLIDNTNISELDLNSYRGKIGYISQEPVIFSDTIYNNITLWAAPTPYNLQKFSQVLRLAHLDEFIATQPRNENSNLGDNGILISGGQKQRIAIARELFKEVEVLIFDEATSALDSETERIIKENIESLHGQYTMIIIAHRLSTIKEADIIYLLEKGKVVESGDFDYMTSNSPNFRKMVSLQEI